MEGDRIKNINCFKCVYFYITWDPKFPKACKFFEFKSRGMPSITVFQSTGSNCIAFEEKEGKCVEKSQFRPKTKNELPRIDEFTAMLNEEVKP